MLIRSVGAVECGGETSHVRRACHPQLPVRTGPKVPSLAVGAAVDLAVTEPGAIHLAAGKALGGPVEVSWTPS